jgi:rifampicin phosphotransferase
MLRYVTWGRKGKRHHGEFFQVVAERIYINATPVWQNSLGRKVHGKALAAVEPSILRGVQEALPVDDSVGGGMSLFLLARMASILFLVVPRFLYTVLFPQHSRNAFIRLMNDKVASIQRQADRSANTSSSSLAQLVQEKEKVLEGFFPFVLFRFIPRMAAGMGPLYLLSRMASSIANGKDLVLTITRGLPHNVTTEMDLKLWEVAKTIRSNSKALQYIRSKDVDVLADEYQRGTLPRVAQATIRSFLDVYGMRGLYEIDFGRPRWREEPAPLFQTIKSYIEIDDNDDSKQENATTAAPDRVFAKGEVAAQHAIDELGRALGKPWLVRFLAHRTRSIAGLRELPKFTCIRIMGIFREKYLEHGARLVQVGKLDNPRDIFFLLDDELRSIDNEDGDGDDAKDWKVVVAQRKAVMDKENGRTAIPRVIASDGFAFYGGAFASKNSAADGDDDHVFVGEPVSPGSVEGIVHIVHDPSKSSLKQGEILVCHGTDPSWTPLFLAARGLVMEVGGLMTHGSVVAREYGIPAVVGLEKITERLQNGQRIRVDGSSGVVSIIQKKEN